MKCTRYHAAHLTVDCASFQKQELYPCGWGWFLWSFKKAPTLTHKEATPLSFVGYIHAHIHTCVHTYITFHKSIGIYDLRGKERERERSIHLYLFF